MPAEAERLAADEWAPPWVRKEHVARYRFAAALARDRRVVDCACGDGSCALELLDAGAREVHGFDISSEAVATAASRVGASNAEFAVASASALPLDRDSADLYVCLETIEHLTEHEALVEEAARVLAPDGVFVCSTPDRDVYSLAGPPWNRFHLRELDREEFLRLLRTRFEEVELYGQNPTFGPGQAIRMRLAGIIGRPLVLRGTQALKLTRLAYDRHGTHALVEARPDRAYELLIAVCRRPIR